ncbi:MAG: hypothetical protein K6B45_10565 [Bacteroidaceae bacterium]|nr:hypothetical protein [Bacteroidaceae bacterium]
MKTPYCKPALEWIRLESTSLLLAGSDTFQISETETGRQLAPPFGGFPGFGSQPFGSQPFGRR